MADSSNIKEAIMRQVQLESSTTSIRTLLENMNTQCFEKCVPKPGDSLSSGEQTCFTTCMEKYMSAWNQVNSAYISRLKREQANVPPGA